MLKLATVNVSDLAQEALASSDWQSGECTESCDPSGLHYVYQCIVEHINKAVYCVRVQLVDGSYRWADLRTWNAVHCVKQWRRLNEEDALSIAAQSPHLKFDKSHPRYPELASRIDQ